MKSTLLIFTLLFINNFYAQCLDVIFPEQTKVCIENPIENNLICFENTFNTLPDLNGNLNINFNNQRKFSFLKSNTFNLFGTNNETIMVQLNGLDNDVPNYFMNRVGIGTNNPSERLEINGNALIKGILNISPSAPDAIIRRSILNEGNLMINSSGTDSSIFFNYSDSSEYYGIAGRGGINIFDGGIHNFAKLWITRGNELSGLNRLPGNLVISPSGGKVIIANNFNEIFNIPGIDNNAINYKLIVQDGILTEKVKVAIRNTTEWSDHVFDEKYELKPLEEVEKYIKENKHLPNIPSSEELVKEGLNLGEMQAKQMEKIEELTLYLIEMKKEINALKKENQELKEAVIKKLKP